MAAVSHVLDQSKTYLTHSLTLIHKGTRLTGQAYGFLSGPSGRGHQLNDMSIVGRLLGMPRSLCFSVHLALKIPTTRLQAACPCLSLSLPASSRNTAAGYAT